MNSSINKMNLSILEHAQSSKQSKQYVPLFCRNIEHFSQLRVKRETGSSSETLRLNRFKPLDKICEYNASEEGN